MAYSSVDHKALKPGLLLMRISNAADLLLACGPSLGLMLEMTVHSRILGCGISPQAIDIRGEYISIDLRTATQPPATTPPQIDGLIQRLRVAICREPIACDTVRAYLQLRTEVLPASAYAAHIRPWTALGQGAVSPHAPDARQPLTLRGDMQSASSLMDDLRAGKLALAFQPIVLLGKTGDAATLYHEALLWRWAPGLNTVQGWPGTIQALERPGWITRLDCSVVWTAVRLLERQPAQRLGCNVSAASLYDDSWWRLLLVYLRRNPPLARRLTLEVTETSVIANFREAKALLADLRAMGVRIAIDDIAADNGMLELLAFTQADVAKIDRSVLQLDGGAASRGLLRDMVAACAAYAPCVVVEGVENSCEFDAVSRAGAQAIQGFLIERPNLRPAWLRQAPAVVADAYV